MKVKYVILSVVILAVAAGVYWKLVSVNISDISSDAAQVDFTYEKPGWLEGHAKQKIIERHIRKELKEVTRSAIETERDFPDRHFTLPFDLSIDLDRTATGDYESILLTAGMYTGGAHGYVVFLYHTTLRSGNDISLSEYLSDKGYSEEELLTLVNEYLRRDEHDTIETFEDIPWQVHPQTDEQPIGIRLIFPPYRVAAGAAGTIIYVF